MPTDVYRVMGVVARLTAIPPRGTGVVMGRMVTRSTDGQRYTVIGAGSSVDAEGAARFIIQAEGER
jgi:hypothetical protein